MNATQVISELRAELATIATAEEREVCIEKFIGLLSEGERIWADYIKAVAQF